MERMIDFTYYVQTDKFNFYNNNYCKFMLSIVSLLVYSEAG